jgi:hypothetical protein
VLVDVLLSYQHTEISGDFDTAFVKHAGKHHRADIPPVVRRFVVIVVVGRDGVQAAEIIKAGDLAQFFFEQKELFKACSEVGDLVDRVYEDDHTQPTEVEKVARTYMTALFHSELDIAVSLMHLVILEQQKANIAKAYDDAKKQGKEKEFRSSFEHIGNLDSLLRLPVPEFWSTLMKKDTERVPVQNLEAMKKSVVKIMGSETVKDPHHAEALTSGSTSFF